VTVVLPPAPEVLDWVAPPTPLELPPMPVMTAPPTPPRPAAEMAAPESFVAPLPAFPPLALELSDPHPAISNTVIAMAETLEIHAFFFTNETPFLDKHPPFGTISSATCLMSKYVFGERLKATETKQALYNTTSPHVVELRKNTPRRTKIRIPLALPGESVMAKPEVRGDFPLIDPIDLPARFRFI
jgi:hypothetical protein